MAIHVGDDLDVVARNRQAAAELVGVGLSSLVAMSPVHGDDLVIVHETVEEIPLTSLGRIAPPADAAGGE